MAADPVILAQPKVWPCKPAPYFYHPVEHWHDAPALQIVEIFFDVDDLVNEPGIDLPIYCASPTTNDPYLLALDDPIE